MNQTAAAKVEEFPGPRMRSFLSFLGLAGGVYIEADRQRKARLAGVDLIEPKGPLEEVLSQVGLDVPNLEMILAKVMGDTPEARRAAAAVIRSRDAAKLLRDFATRCAGGSSQATTTPPPGDSTSTSTNATSESGTTTTTPPPDPTPQAPTAAPPATPPIFHPPQTYAAQQPAAARGDGSTTDALGSWFYSPTDPNLAYRPEYDPLGQGAPPGWRAAPVRKRPPPPPPRVPPNPAKTSSRRGWSLGNLPTRPRRTDSPTATPRAAPKPSYRKRSDTAATTASASTTAPKSTSDAQVLKDFIAWAKAKIEALESRMNAELAATRRQLEEAIQRLARLERAYEALIASRRDPARVTDARVEPEAAVALEVVKVEAAQEVVVEVEAADGEVGEEPGSEPQVLAENAELDPISEAVGADDMEVETEAPILDEGIEPKTELTALNVPPTEDELNDPDERAETLDPQAIATCAEAITDDASVDRILDDDAEEGPDAAVVEANATHVDLEPELEDDAAPSPAPAEASLIQLAQAQTQALLDAHQEQRQRELREMQGQLAAVNERIRQMEAVCPT